MLPKSRSRTTEHYLSKAPKEGGKRKKQWQHTSAQWISDIQTKETFVTFLRLSSVLLLPWASRRRKNGFQLSTYRIYTKFSDSYVRKNVNFISNRFKISSLIRIYTICHTSAVLGSSHGKVWFGYDEQQRYKYPVQTGKNVHTYVNTILPLTSWHRFM